MAKNYTVPRTGSRQFRALVTLIRTHRRSWISDSGDGHQSFVDDINRLRDKGWPIEDRLNDDGRSRSYRINPDEWKKIKGDIGAFWE